MSFNFFHTGIQNNSTPGMFLSNVPLTFSITLLYQKINFFFLALTVNAIFQGGLSLFDPGADQGGVLYIRVGGVRHTSPQQRTFNLWSYTLKYVVMTCLMCVAQSTISIC